GLRCLVIDDDPAVLEGTRMLLAQWGCLSEGVAGVAPALAALARPGRRFDAVLCDLQLAGEDDGVQVIDAARRLQPDALAVLVSGATGPEVLQRLRQLGVMLLTKPVAPAKLRALLSTCRRAG
ncbi:MAG TPA: response regulator, partial [Candidatus Limnocylindrales bacterium]|nr:response regulator [Candidatus Limnocylindrales bacterium]